MVVAGHHTAVGEFDRKMSTLNQSANFQSNSSCTFSDVPVTNKSKFCMLANDFFLDKFVDLEVGCI